MRCNPCRRFRPSSGSAEPKDPRRWLDRKEVSCAPRVSPSRFYPGSDSCGAAHHAGCPATPGWWVRPVAMRFRVPRPAFRILDSRVSDDARGTRGRTWRLSRSRSCAHAHIDGPVGSSRRYWRSRRAQQSGCCCPPRIWAPWPDVSWLSLACLLRIPLVDPPMLLAYGVCRSDVPVCHRRFGRHAPDPA